ncbi:hypothetical protein ACM66B_002275 [Microbotryomycetes sp. NB124-2]
MFSDDDTPPPSDDKRLDELSWVELQRAISHSPKHQRIVARHRAILIISAVAFGVGLIWVFLLCHLGQSIIGSHKWLIFHFVAIQVLIVANIGLAWLFRKDMDLLAEPWVLRIDIFRMLLPLFVAIGLVFYVFFKLKSFVTPETFAENWSVARDDWRSDTNMTLSKTQSAPSLHSLIPSLQTLVAFGKFFGCLLLVALVAECWISWILYTDPVLNPSPEELKKEEESNKQAQLEKQRKKKIKKGKRKANEKKSAGLESSGFASGGRGLNEKDDLLGSGLSEDDFGLHAGGNRGRIKSLARSSASGSRRR